MSEVNLGIPMSSPVTSICCCTDCMTKTRDESRERHEQARFMNIKNTMAHKCVIWTRAGNAIFADKLKSRGRQTKKICEQGQSLKIWNNEFGVEITVLSRLACALDVQTRLSLGIGKGVKMLMSREITDWT